MYITALTVAHVAVSLVAIAAGFVFVYGLIANKRLPGWTAFFLATTVATSASGFLFPYKGITPGIVFGVISLVALGAAYYALYSRRLAGVWRGVFVLTSIFAFYLNFLVLIVQSFRKVSFLHALAPTGGEWPVTATQLAALAMFIAFGVLAYRRYHAPAAVTVQTV